MGKYLLDREEEEAKRLRQQTRRDYRSQEERKKEESGDYQRESTIVYVGGFDRRLAFEDLENFL